MTMEMKVVTDADFGKISRKIWELLRRVKEGTLNPRTVDLQLQQIIEGVTKESLDVEIKEIHNRANENFRIHPNGGGRLIDNADVDEEAYIGPNAIVAGDVWIRSGKVRIEDHAIVKGDMVIADKVCISGSAVVLGNLLLSDSVRIEEEALVVGVRSGAILGKDLIICGRSGKPLTLEGFYNGGFMK
ncbi:hypothetical protein KAR91_03155 [Candidatus Pacearchaeota archaeon]|nr:hypothetical protein [Candidatus Pacearchaeota archaeon]